MSIAHVDLNLLRTLHVLLAEGSVTRAASRLGVSQSAVSHGLAKLRQRFDDPLVVRSGAAMVPTARAEALVEPLKKLVEGADALLEPDARFDPATSQRAFTVEAVDQAQLLLFPKLMRALARDAPGVSVAVRKPLEGAYAALEKGSLDLALGMHTSPPAGIRRRALYRVELACLVRRGHPVVKDRLTLDRYESLSHVLVAPRGGTEGIVDRALARLGRRRRIALVVPEFLAAPLIVAETDLVLTIDAHLARTFAAIAPLRVFSPPIDVPGYEIAAAWHERWHRDPGHKWFRRLLADTAPRR
jgi:DNA-binding transcriptional LysR family regulator